LGYRQFTIVGSGLGVSGSPPGRVAFTRCASTDLL